MDFLFSLSNFSANYYYCFKHSICLKILWPFPLHFIPSCITKPTSKTSVSLPERYSLLLPPYASAAVEPFQFHLHENVFILTSFFPLILPHNSRIELVVTCFHCFEDAIPLSSSFQCFIIEKSSQASLQHDCRGPIYFLFHNSHKINLCFHSLKKFLVLGLFS